MGKIREVRKRDNRIVPFDPTKIADAIYAAIRSVGEGTRTLAEELTAVVTEFLEKKFPDSIPGIEDIQDLVEKVLMECGHARVAKAYILYRQKRATLRDLQVRKNPGHTGEGITYDYAASESSPWEAPLLEVDQGLDGVSLWHKSKIAAALIREADLDPSLAEEIASNVERKVLDSGLKRISTSLIRELVDNELFERGFSSKLQKQAPLGLPKYNLEQLIFGTDSKEGFTFPKTPTEVRNIIANRILHQYSLEEVFTPAVADAHREGRIFIHRLSDPIRLSSLLWRLPPPGCLRRDSFRPAASGDRSLDAADAGAGSVPATYLDLRDFFRRLWHLAHFFSEEVRLTGLSSLLADPASRSLTEAEKVRGILERLTQMDTRPSIALELDLSPETLPWLEGLLGLAQVHKRRFVIALRLRRDLRRAAVAGPLLQAIAELYERGERVEFLPEREGPGPSHGPAAARGTGQRLAANAAKITINLPRAAFRSGRGKGQSIETELDDALDLAIKGHLERRRFIERLASNRENPLWDLLGRAGGAPLLSGEDIAFSIGIVGLNECVKFLRGSDLHADAAAARQGVEIVRQMDRKIRREERSLGIRLVLEETANIGPVRVLERADRKKYPQMAEVDRGRQSEWGAAYTDGVRFHRMAPVDPLRRVEELAAYLRFLEPSGGFVEDLPELRSSAGELLVSLLEECLPIVAA